MPRLILLLLLSVLLAGCAHSGGTYCPATNNRPTRPALINHIVFFQLNDPADADELIAVCDERLGTIPGVVSYFCGKHIDTGRANIDTDYDVGFFVGFNSEEDYAAYVSHPEHIAVVQEWRPKFKSLVVRDIFDDTP